MLATGGSAVATTDIVKRWGVKKIKFVGFDSSPTLVDALKKGELNGLVVQNPYKMGYEGVKAVALHNNGQSSPRLIDTGVEIVTSESLTDPKIIRLLGLQQ